MKIGTNIRKWRSINGIKQRDLATALNLSEAAISNMENNVTDVSANGFSEIAKAVGVTVEELLRDPAEFINAQKKMIDVLKYENEQLILANNVLKLISIT